MKLDPEQIKKLAQQTLDAKPAHVSCSDWIHRVGEFVEARLRGDELSTERLRSVWQHAKDCPPCMDELEALERLLDAEG